MVMAVRVLEFCRRLGFRMIHTFPLHVCDG